MSRLMDVPFTILALSFVTLCACAWFGAAVLGRQATEDQAAHEDFRTVLAACLTLLGLIVGFSFAMAVSRYDLRKSYEAAEASAIGTAFARADLLDASDADRTRELLRDYLAQRIVFFTTRDVDRLHLVDDQTAPLLHQLWSVARSTAVARPTPISALVVSGVNDVASSEGKHSGGVVEPHPDRGVGADGPHRHHLQRHARVFGAPDRAPRVAGLCCHWSWRSHSS